jgi:hypothetical protein
MADTGVIILLYLLLGQAQHLRQALRVGAQEVLQEAVEIRALGPKKKRKG